MRSFFQQFDVTRVKIYSILSGQLAWWCLWWKHAQPKVKRIGQWEKMIQETWKKCNEYARGTCERDAGASCAGFQLKYRFQCIKSHVKIHPMAPGDASYRL